MADFSKTSAHNSRTTCVARNTWGWIRENVVLDSVNWPFNAFHSFSVYMFENITGCTVHLLEENKKLDLVKEIWVISVLDRQTADELNSWVTAEMRETKSPRFQSKSTGKWPTEQSPQHSLYSCNLASKIDLVIFTVMHSSPWRNCRLRLNVSGWLSGASEKYLSRSPTAYLLAALVWVRAGQAWEARYHSVISSTPENPGI